MHAKDSFPPLKLVCMCEGKQKLQNNNNEVLKRKTGKISFSASLKIFHHIIIWGVDLHPKNL